MSEKHISRQRGLDHIERMQLEAAQKPPYKAVIDDRLATIVLEIIERPVIPEDLNEGLAEFVKSTRDILAKIDTQRLDPNSIFLAATMMEDLLYEHLGFLEGFSELGEGNNRE